jgi:tetratricopeptide (TPR) repeat protein
MAVERALGSLSGEAWLGPLVIILFADADDYVRYVSPLEEDREFFRTAAVCIRDGYVHIALRPYPLDTLETASIHEITHACLSHLVLPLWLEEGITQWAETAVFAGKSSLELNREDVEAIRGHWRGQSLSDFWWGSGFHTVGERQKHSYGLARILFHWILSDHPKRLPDFVRDAHESDAGEGSAREHLGMGLAELAGRFLGPGDWEPVPPDAPALRRRAVLFAEREQWGPAMADFEESLRLEPEAPEGYCGRGHLRRLLGDFAAAVADYEQALQLEPDRGDFHNNLAWLLATCPVAAHRDGERSLVHAQRACELSPIIPWYCLGTLAAAHAEAGDFEEAVSWATESLESAPEEELPGCEARLEQYRRREPYRTGADGR